MAWPPCSWFMVLGSGPSRTTFPPAFEGPFSAPRPPDTLAWMPLHPHPDHPPPWLGITPSAPGIASTDPGNARPDFGCPALRSRNREFHPRNRRIRPRNRRNRPWINRHPTWDHPMPRLGKPVFRPRMPRCPSLDTPASDPGNATSDPGIVHSDLGKALSYPWNPAKRPTPGKISMSCLSGRPLLG